jgi:hypothetical protein
MSRLNPLGTASGILRAAKALIEARGWRSGLTHDNNAGGYPKFEYPLCSYVAIIEAKGGHRSTAQAIKALADATEQPQTFGAGFAVIDWNDKHGRTLDQVNAGFDRAITAAEAS